MQGVWYMRMHGSRACVHKVMHITNAPLGRVLKRVGVTCHVHRDPWRAHSRDPPPIHGKNARFEALVEDARKRILKPQEREDGTVDMRDLGKQITVDKGDALMRRLPPEGGRDGFTIKGETLPAEGGDDIALAAGEGTEISDQDPDLLVATKVGMPWFTHNLSLIHI